jgi:hypothetical protein
LPPNIITSVDVNIGEDVRLLYCLLITTTYSHPHVSDVAPVLGATVGSWWRAESMTYTWQYFNDHTLGMYCVTSCTPRTNVQRLGYIIRVITGLKATAKLQQKDMSTGRQEADRANIALSGSLCHLCFSAASLTNDDCMMLYHRCLWLWVMCYIV